MSQRRIGLKPGLNRVLASLPAGPRIDELHGQRSSPIFCLKERLHATSAKENVMSNAHEGGCLCGAVRYRVEGNPDETEGVGICHCRFCKRRTGSAFGTQVFSFTTMPSDSQEDSSRPTSIARMRQVDG